MNNLPSLGRATTQVSYINRNSVLLHIIKKDNRVKLTTQNTAGSPGLYASSTCLHKKKKRNKSSPRQDLTTLQLGSYSELNSYP